MSALSARERVQLCGVAGAVPSWSPAGRTDREIALDSIRARGIDPHAVRLDGLQLAEHADAPVIAYALELARGGVAGSMPGAEQRLRPVHRMDAAEPRGDMGPRAVAADRVRDAARAVRVALEMFQKAGDDAAVTRMKAIASELEVLGTDASGRADATEVWPGGPRWPDGYDRARAIAALRADGSDLTGTESDAHVYGRITALLKARPGLRQDTARADADEGLAELERCDGTLPLPDPKLEQRARMMATGRTPLANSAHGIQGKTDLDVATEMRARSDAALVAARKQVVHEHVLAQHPRRER